MPRKKPDHSKRRTGLVTKPCPACGEEEARLLSSLVHEYAARSKDGTLGGTTIPNTWKADSDAFGEYLRHASNGDEEAALTALRQVLIWRPERLWHPYVQSQFSHLLVHEAHSDLPRAFRDRANKELVGLIQAWVMGLGYWAEISRSSSPRGQTPSLFPLIGEREGLHETAEAGRHEQAAADFLMLWGDLKERLKKIPWKAKRNEYRAVSPSGKELAVNELVEELTPILRDFLAHYQGPGSHFLAYCGLTGEFPSDKTLREMTRKALAVPIGRNPRDTIGYEFLGRLKFNVGGWEMLKEWPPRSASPTLIKSTLKTLWKRYPTLRKLLRRM
jgi:hypothetical protein